MKHQPGRPPGELVPWRGLLYLAAIVAVAVIAALVVLG